MTLNLTKAQKCNLTLAPKKADGSEAKVAGVPVWTVSDGAILTFVPAADGLSAMFTTTDVVGPCTVTAVANADLSGGTRELTATLDVVVSDVVPSTDEAQTLEIVAGTPEPK